MMMMMMMKLIKIMMKTVMKKVKILRRAAELPPYRSVVNKFRLLFDIRSS